MQRSLKLTLPCEPISLICLSCLSSFSTLSLVFLSTVVETSSSYYWTLWWLNWGGEGCGMLIWTEGICKIWHWGLHLIGHIEENLNLARLGKEVDFKSAHHHRHHVSDFSELILLLVEFGGRYCHLLGFFILYHCVQSRAAWASEARRSLLRCYNRFLVWREDNRMKWPCVQRIVLRDPLLQILILLEFESSRKIVFVRNK